MTARPDEVVAWLVLYRGKHVGYATPDSVEHVRLAEEETLEPVVLQAALQSANARLAAVLALADEWERLAATNASAWDAVTFNLHATQIRRAAAGEGDAPPIEIDTPTVASGEL